MKLTIFFSFLLVITGWGKTLSQTTKLSLNLKNVPVQEMIQQIEDLTEFYFLYQDDVFRKDQKVTIETREASVESILQQMAEQALVQYRIFDRQIVLLPQGQTELPAGIKRQIHTVIQQTKSVTGIVTDSSGSPIPGVSIVVKGTTIGVITDTNGNYSLSNIPENATLQFSFVGMKTQEISVSGKTSINVSMEEETIGIEEVVAVGYGTMRKADITGSIVSVKGDVIATAGTFSVSQAMQGKMAGVQITNNGDAGSDSKIRIRGINTIGNNDPIVVVDGITTGMNIKDLNPENIESIEVLKDASSLAIFGSRASNGVVIITTKKGRYGSKRPPKVTLDASHAFSYVAKTFDLVSAAQLVNIRDEARKTENEQLGGNYLLYDEIWPNDNWARQDLTDWQDELFNLAITQNYSLSVSGGSEHTIYGLGASYRDQEGTLIGNNAKRFTLSSNFETKILNDKLKIGSTMNYSQTEQQGSAQSDIWGAYIFRAAQTPPSTPTYFDDGITPYQETDQDKIAYIIPGDILRNKTASIPDVYNPANKLLGSFYAELEIIDGLKVKSLYGISYSQDFSRSYNSLSLNPLGDPASLSVSAGRSSAYSLDNTITYNKKIGLHSIDAMTGVNAYNLTNNGLNAKRSNFPDGDPMELRYLDFGDAGTQTNTESASNVRLASYFGRLNYSFNDKYLLTATFRRDGSSRFYKDVRWGTFPSFSLGWRISEEGFMKSLTWLDMLKFRGSWGQVGNQSAGNYAYISSVRSGHVGVLVDGKTDYIFGADPYRATGKIISQRGNENLTWESTTMTNFGFDLVAGKISATMEYFYNKTNDILLDSQFPEIAGYVYGLYSVTGKVNAGQVDTKGVDFNIDYRNSKGNFQYSVGLNGSYLKNEIVYLGDREYIQGSTANYHNVSIAMSRSYEGDPIGSFYGYQLNGIFNTQAEVDAANQNAREKAKAADPTLTDTKLSGLYYISAKTAPGDYKFKDNNGDGIITDNDKAYLGHGNPDFTFGLNFTCNYKQFDASLNISGVAGVQIHALFEPSLSLPSGGGSLTSMLDHWTPENKTDNFPRYTMTDPNNNMRPSDKWLYDGSYAKVQNLVIGYTLPSSRLKKTGVNGIRIYMNAQNLFTVTSYPFLDPEVKGSDVGASIDVGNSPIPRTFIFGINVGF